MLGVGVSVGDVQLLQRGVPRKYSVLARDVWDPLPQDIPLSVLQFLRHGPTPTSQLGRYVASPPAATGGAATPDGRHTSDDGAGVFSLLCCCGLWLAACMRACAYYELSGSWPGTMCACGTNGVSSVGLAG